MNIFVIKNTLEVSSDAATRLLDMQDLMFDVLHEDDAVATAKEALDAGDVVGAVEADYVEWTEEGSEHGIVTPHGFAWWQNEGDMIECDAEDQRLFLQINTDQGPHADFLQVPQFQQIVAEESLGGDLLLSDEDGNLWGYRADGQGNLQALNYEETLSILLQDERARKADPDATPA